MDKPLIVEDALVHPLVCKNPAIADLGVAAYLGQPIHAADGTPIGAICAIQTKPRKWSDNEISAMKLLAELVDEQITRATPQAA